MPDNDDTIFLAVQFQGLEISIRGPATRALDFVHRLSPSASSQSAPTPAAAPVPASTSASDSAVPECPRNLLSLSSRLSAASILSPVDRIERAWALGFRAGQQLEGQATSEEPVISIDLPANYFVVLRGNNISGPKILRSRRDFARVLEGAEEPGIGHEFPSETEARVFLAGAGRRLPLELR